MTEVQPVEQLLQVIGNFLSQLSHLNNHVLSSLSSSVSSADLVVSSMPFGLDCLS
jgi:hypothetical protein